MAKRTTITLCDRVYSDLEQWAAAEGRPVANLAAFLIELMVNEKTFKGKIQEMNDRLDKLEE